MKKIFLNESERLKLISEKEKLIIESFAKTFNKIKRIDENGLDEMAGKNLKDIIINIPDEHALKLIKNTSALSRNFSPRQLAMLQVGNNELTVNHYIYSNLMRSYPEGAHPFGTKDKSAHSSLSEESRYGENGSELSNGTSDLKLKFDRIFNEILSMEPKYSYIETQSARLSGRYNRRSVSDGKTTATLNNNELGIELIITYNNSWEEDPDGASYHGYLSMSYEHWNDFGDNELDDILTKFGQEELIENPGTGLGGVSIENVKYYNMVDDEFMSLLSDETKQKLYGQIEGVLIKHDENQNSNYDNY
jgi:hypothetical protein